MKWLSNIRLLTYALVIAAVAIWYTSRTGGLPIGLFSSEKPAPSNTVGGKEVRYRLSDPESFPAAYREAARAVASAIEKDGLIAKEYWVNFVADDTVVHFGLWHESYLTNQEEYRKWHGDPTGKCRSVEYDLATKSVTHIYGWR